MEHTESKKIDFIALASTAMAWARKVTFSPFSLKKIFILAFIAWLGAGMQGCHMSYWPNHDMPAHPFTQSQNPPAVKNTQNAVSGIKINDPNIMASTEKCALPKSANFINMLYPAAIGIIVAVAAILIALIFFLSWISARFTFIFFEDTLKNDASIHDPFHRYKKEGNSLFVFNLVYMALFLGLVCLVFLTGFDLNSLTHKNIIGLVMCNIPLIIILAIITLAGALVSTFTYDFVVPIMYHDRIKITAAWKVFWEKLKSNKKNILVYLLLKIAFGVFAAIAAIAVCLVLAIIIILLGLAAGMIFYALGHLAVKAAPLLAYIFYILAAITCIIFLFILFAAMLIVILPVALFFRVFSIKFFESIAGNYNFFHNSSSPGLP